MKVACLALTVVMFAGSVHSVAATTAVMYQHTPAPDMIITELQTASAESSGEEFIELYNATNDDIDFADSAHGGKDAWKLQYFAGTKVAGLTGSKNWASPSRTIALTGIAPAHDYYLLAAGPYTPGNIVPDQSYAATLADDGGALQLVDSITSGNTTTMSIHDQLGWFTSGLVANGIFYNAPGAGKSLQRLPNKDDEYINSDSTLTGFISDSDTSPDNAWAPPVPASNQPPGDGSGTVTTPIDNGGSSTSSTLNNNGLIPPELTELLPNPASPATDEQAEFIELYNPNSSSFNLNGYTLETGQTTLRDFTFTSDTLLPPGGYTAFYSAQTGLPLSNSGGQARLLDKTGTILSQTDVYGVAADGESWALNMQDGSWGWSTTPTPDAENSITLPALVVKTAVSKVTKPKITKAKITGKSTTKKAKITKVKVKKAATKKVPDTKLASTTADTPAPIHPWLLAGVAALAVGYGVYEYRHDLANRFHKFRADRAARRKARA